jgi:hypothetical protein
MRLETLLARHRAAGIIVDTNLLLLLLIGSHNPTLISSFKRTTRYTASDFHLLVETLALFSTLLTTAHILTEVSNLAGQLGDPGRQDVMRDLAEMIPIAVPRQHRCGSLQLQPPANVSPQLNR